MFFRSHLLLLIGLLGVFPAAAQSTRPAPSAAAMRSLGPYTETPTPYEILGLTVEGVENERMQAFVLQTSGLRVGQTVTIPGDPAFADAIRSIYQLGQFSDVRITEDQRAGQGVFLAIRVKEEPRLADYAFQGIRKGHRSDLRKEVPLIKGATVRPSEIERTKQVILDFYREKGYVQAEVDVRSIPSAEGNGVTLTFDVRRGPRAEIAEIDIEGNEEISDRRLQRKMKDTKEDRWWRFWDRETFDREKYREDLQHIVEFYNEKGYYDAQIVSDTVYVRDEGGDPEVVVRLKVREGQRYKIRSIEWEGNTVYSDEFLTEALGFEPGEVYNSKKLEQNLYANKQNADVASLYMNRGYMRFSVQPEFQVVGGDSLDLHFDVFEGDVYSFGDIEIVGNTKTKEHVVRRELYTVPGQTFSREAIQETIRRLSQLTYFAQESLAAGPNVEINEEEKTVDLTYKLEEAGSDQLELSGTWARFGLVLSLRFNFNNFSAQNLFKKDAWKPLPSGDGQKLSVGVQTNGTFYQNYSLSFTEPWFRGKPTPIGFSVSYSKWGQSPYFNRFSSQSAGGLQTGTARFFYDQRLKWPDDKFSISTGIRYQYYDNDSLFVTIPQGVSQVVTLQQSISRSSLNHPIFPTGGSQASLSLEVAPPIGGFVQYHKWRFTSQWNVPLASKLTLGLTGDFGFVGSLNGDPVQFERFIIGGSPFDTQGLYSFFGRDIIYMRGYPAAAIGPRQSGEAVGGTIVNRYTSELRWLAVQSQQLQAAPYVFMDAANTWNGFSSYNPTELFRSAGLGIRMFLPILGMLELSYGYNFDQFTPISGQESRHNGDSRWSFQFSLGQGLGN